MQKYLSPNINDALSLRAFRTFTKGHLLPLCCCFTYMAPSVAGALELLVLWTVIGLLRIPTIDFIFKEGFKQLHEFYFRELASLALKPDSCC